MLHTSFSVAEQVGGAFRAGDRTGPGPPPGALVDGGIAPFAPAVPAPMATTAESCLIEHGFPAE